MSAALSQPRVNPDGWKHYVNDEWFDRPEIARDADLERLAFRFERIAREKPYALTGNDELMEALGISRNTLAALLTRYELAGWGRRVLIPGGHGKATNRLGFVLFVRPTNRATGTPATFDQIVKMMRADITRTKSRPRTVPFASPEPDRSPISGYRGPQFLGTDGPQILGTAHCSKEDEVTAQKTTTTGPELSSSSLNPSTQNQEPESPVTIELPPSTEDPPAVPELPAELVTVAAEVIPGSSPTWLRGLLSACGQHGLALALLVIAWVKARLEHPEPKKRPANPHRYAMTAAVGWRVKLEAEPALTSLDDIRAEIRASPRARSPDQFDPAGLLDRIRAEGHAFRVKADGSIERVAVRDGASEWEGPACAQVRREARAHADELTAYLQKQAGKGAPRADE